MGDGSGVQLFREGSVPSIRWAGRIVKILLVDVSPNRDQIRSSKWHGKAGVMPASLLLMPIRVRLVDSTVWVDLVIEGSK